MLTLATHALRHATRHRTQTLLISCQMIVGASAALVVGALVSAVLFGPLGYAEPDRLAWILGIDQKTGTDRGGISPADFLDLQTRTTAFAELGARLSQQVVVRDVAGAYRLSA